MSEEYYWLKVTTDKYELPLIVADSRTELAQLAGVTIGTISEQLSRCKSNGKKCPYTKVRRLIT